MKTCIAWYESIDQAAAYENLAGVADPHVTVTGDNIKCPALNNLYAIAGGIDTTVAGRLRLVAPSILNKAKFMVAPLNGQAAAAQEPDSPQAVVDLRNSPAQFVVGENLSVESFANPAAAQVQWVVAFLSDGPVQAVQGNIFTVRATSATAAVAGSWTNVALTFDSDLARGKYRIVGFRPESAGMVAARILTKESSNRPGALGCDLVGDQQHSMFRYGNSGDYGAFEDTDPPTVDVLAVSADATQVFYFDLIQERAGN